MGQTSHLILVNVAYLADNAMRSGNGFRAAAQNNNKMAPSGTNYNASPPRTHVIINTTANNDYSHVIIHIASR